MPFLMGGGNVPLIGRRAGGLLAGGGSGRPSIDFRTLAVDDPVVSEFATIEGGTVDLTEVDGTTVLRLQGSSSSAYWSTPGLGPRMEVLILSRSAASTGGGPAGFIPEDEVYRLRMYVRTSDPRLGGNLSHSGGASGIPNMDTGAGIAPETWAYKRVRFDVANQRVLGKMWLPSEEEPAAFVESAMQGEVLDGYVGVSMHSSNPHYCRWISVSADFDSGSAPSPDA